MLPTYAVTVRGDRLRLTSVRADILGLPSPANDAFFRALVGRTVELVGTSGHPGRAPKRLHRPGDREGLPSADYRLSTPTEDADFDTDLEDGWPPLAAHRDPDRVAALWADVRSDRPGRVGRLIAALTETRVTAWHAADALRQLALQGGDVGDAVPALCRTADAPELNAASYALRALGSIADARAIGPLVIALGRLEPYRTTYALRALGVFGPSIAADSVARVTVPDGLPRWQDLAVRAAVAWARWRVLGEDRAAFTSLAVPGDADASAAVLEVLWDLPAALLSEVLPSIPRDGLVQRDWLSTLAARIPQADPR